LNERLETSLIKSVTAYVVTWTLLAGQVVF